jgi:hypothetical protein
MKKRWLLFLGLAVVLGAVGTVSAMPADKGGTTAVPAGARVPDIRPFLADKTVPADVVNNHRPGFRAFARPGQGVNDYMVDDFEEQVLNDNLWLRVYDLDDPPTEYGEYYWSLSRCRSNPPGGQSFWAIGGGADGSKLQCGATYPNGVASAAIMRLDLSTFVDPTQLDLVWDFWLNTRTVEMGGVAPDGLFLILLYDNPQSGRTEWVTLAAITSEYPERFFQEPWRVDLLKAKEIYPPYREFDLHAMGQVNLMFLFKSKREPGGELPEGVYIDNVRLASDVAPVTPTPGGDTPTPTPSEVTPTVETPTPSDTPEITPGTPSDTPEVTPVTPTDTPETPDTPTTELPFKTYLPALANGAEPQP